SSSMELDTQRRLSPGKPEPRRAREGKGVRVCVCLRPAPLERGNRFSGKSDCDQVTEIDPKMTPISRMQRSFFESEKSDSPADRHSSPRRVSTKRGSPCSIK